MKRMSQQIKHAANHKAMTLNELAAFVQHALRSGADGTETVKAAITFSGKLKDIAVDITTARPHDATTSKTADEDH